MIQTLVYYIDAAITTALLVIPVIFIAWFAAKEISYLFGLSKRPTKKQERKK